MILIAAHAKLFLVLEKKVLEKKSNETFFPFRVSVEIHSLTSQSCSIIYLSDYLQLHFTGGRESVTLLERTCHAAGHQMKRLAFSIRVKRTESPALK